MPFFPVPFFPVPFFPVPFFLHSAATPIPPNKMKGPGLRQMYVMFVLGFVGFVLVVRAGLSVPARVR